MNTWRSSLCRLRPARGLALGRESQNLRTPSSSPPAWPMPGRVATSSTVLRPRPARPRRRRLDPTRIPTTAPIPPSASRGVASPVSLLKTELAARGKPNFPIVLTEWGFSTDRNDYGVSTDTHAKFAVRQILMGYYTGLTINCVYSLDDARNVDDNTSDKHYGLSTTSGANFAKTLVAKPAVAKVAALNGRPRWLPLRAKGLARQHLPAEQRQGMVPRLLEPHRARCRWARPAMPRPSSGPPRPPTRRGRTSSPSTSAAIQSFPPWSADTNSNYNIFGSLVKTPPASMRITTWGLGATYSGGALPVAVLQWLHPHDHRRHLRPRHGSTTSCVNVDPAASTYSFTITGGSTNTPARPAFLSRHGTAQQRVFFGARDDKDHPAR